MSAVTASADSRSAPRVRHEWRESPRAVARLRARGPTVSSNATRSTRFSTRHRFAQRANGKRRLLRIDPLVWAHERSLAKTATDPFRTSLLLELRILSAQSLEL